LIGLGRDIAGVFSLDFLIVYSPINLIKKVDKASIKSKMIGANIRLNVDIGKF